LPKDEAYKLIIKHYFYFLSNYNLWNQV
jgi:hypothetical protein